jgi:hypothetical protein
MGFSFKRFSLLLGGLGLLVAVIFTPEVAARLLSADGVLEPHTVEEVHAWRMMLGLISVTMLLLSVIWTISEDSAMVRRISADFAQWQNPVRNLNAENRSWARMGLILVWLLVALSVVTIWLSFEYFGTRWFALLAFENGLVENLQAICLLIAGVVLMRQGWSDYRGGKGPFSLIGLLYGLLLIIGAGEEVSWGQHWLGFETPEEMKDINVQGEFNLHNIGSYWINHMQALLFLVYVGIWPALGYVYPHLHYLLDRMSMPIAPLSVLPVVLIGTTMDEHEVIARLWNTPPWRLSEGRELLFAGTMLMITLLMRRYRKRP